MSVYQIHQLQFLRCFIKLQRHRHWQCRIVSDKFPDHMTRRLTGCQSADSTESHWEFLTFRPLGSWYLFIYLRLEALKFKVHWFNDHEMPASHKFISLHICTGQNDIPLTDQNPSRSSKYHNCFNPGKMPVSWKPQRTFNITIPIAIQFE